MVIEFFWLTLTLIFSALMWVPYIVQYILENSLRAALMAGQGTQSPKTGWAARLKKAHANNVENLVLFAPLVIVAVMSETNNEITAIAAMVYFFSRVVYTIIFMLGLPILRSPVFATGFVCLLAIGFSILGLI